MMSRKIWLVPIIVAIAGISVVLDGRRATWAEGSSPGTIAGRSLDLADDKPAQTSVDKPEQVVAIEKVLGKWLEACQARDVETMKELYHPNTRSRVEQELKNMDRILALAPKDWSFSPMVVKFSESDADVTSSPFTVDHPQAADPVVMILRLRSVQGQWTVLNCSGDTLRDVPNSYAHFLRRYPDGQIWCAPTAPDWLKPGAETELDSALRDIAEARSRSDITEVPADRFRESIQNREIFESYFPDSAEDASRLDEWWKIKDRDGQWKYEHGWELTDEEILEMVRKGLRRSTIQYKSNFVMQYVGGGYVWRREPDNMKALELMYHASFDPEYLYYAVYSGLSVANPKPEHVLKRLVDLCMAYKQLGRIIWGVKASRQKEEFLELLRAYLNSPDEQVQERAELVREAFAGEIDASEWERQWDKRQLALEVGARFGDKLPQIRQVLMDGNSRQRRELFKLVRSNRLHALFDDSFREVLMACARDGDPEVKRAAIEYGGDRLCKPGQDDPEVMELMAGLSKDWDSKVREAVAVFVGSRWVWGSKPQRAEAIEIMMGLSRDRDHEVRSDAVYYGLSVVNNKSDEVVRRLVEMAVDEQATNDFGRISWGLKRKADKEKILGYLQPYLALKDKTGALARRLYREVFDEEYPESPADK